MNLPKVIADLVKAQDDFDSVAYANCFAETAVVFDEGHTHTGKKEIEKWIAKSNENYKSLMKPVEYEEKGSGAILTSEVSGTFPGSPAILQFHFEIAGGLIRSLKITG